MSNADDLFRKEAEECTRQNPEWSYAKEAGLLKSTFLEILSRNRKIAEIRAKSTKQNQQAMQYLQIQNQQLQAMQQQLMVRLLLDSLYYCFVNLFFASLIFLFLINPN